MCQIVEPVCIGKSIVGGAAEAVAGSAISDFASAVSEGVGTVVGALGTLWVKVGTPNLTTSPGGSTPSPTVGFLQEHLWWYMTAAAVIAVILGGARMAWEQRSEPGRELLKALLTLVVVAGAGLTAISLAVDAADQFSNWIIEGSLHGGSFGTNLTALLGFSTASGSLGAMLVIVLGLLAIFASIVQIALMVVRGGMLVIAKRLDG
jgi:type IV secretion system protein TrbL